MTVYPSVPPPPVVTWFKVYAGIMSLLYLLLTGVGVFFLAAGPMMADLPPSEAILMGGIFLIVSVPLLAAFGAALVLPPKPWAWIYDIVLISLGFLSCLTLPFCIALLIYWLKPETGAYFGRR